MTLFEMLAEGAQRVRENYGWGGSFAPSNSDEDKLSQPDGLGPTKVDGRQWQKKDVKVTQLDLGEVVNRDNQQYQASATVYPGLSAGQYELVKSQIEAVHGADKYKDTPFYEGQAVKITSTLQADSVVIVVTAQQKDEPPQAIGYLNIGPVDSKTGQRQIGILVLEAFRKQKIAKRLFKYVVENGANLNLSKFWVDYDSRNRDVDHFLIMIEEHFSKQVEVEHDRTNGQRWSATLVLKSNPRP